MGLQPIDENTQGQENKELTNTGKDSLQTSLQTNPENALKSGQDLPPELAEIVEAWPALPEHIKQAIKSLIHTQFKEPKV